MTTIRKYVLDSLQIYFPWDDDLYTYLKQQGLTSKNPRLKVLPLIYADNCESSLGVKELARNYVLDPNYYGLSDQQCGWKRIRGRKKFIIPSEKPELHISSTNEEELELIIIPNPNQKNEYHIEYSITSSFGKMYSNWVIFYLSLNNAKQLMKDFLGKYKDSKNDLTSTPGLEVDVRQKQRETLHWTPLKIIKYCFSIGGFDYAENYLKNSGVKGNMPALVYNSKNPKHCTKMEPFLKLGFVETRDENGFYYREAQLTFKISQNKMTTGKRGKRVKVKGLIDTKGSKENYITLSTSDFIDALVKVRFWYNKQPDLETKI